MADLLDKIKEAEQMLGNEEQAIEIAKLMNLRNFEAILTLVLFGIKKTFATTILAMVVIIVSSTHICMPMMKLTHKL